MRRAVVTGLGFITSIGNSRAEVLASLRDGRSGIEVHPELDRPGIPVKLAGTVKGFRFPTTHPESWQFPPGLQIPRKQLRSLPPHGVFAHAAMREAIADAQLPPELIAHPRTGMFCASGGSTWLLTRHIEQMLREGVLRCPPFSVASGVAGTLNFNLASHFNIQGASGGFVSACASSAHAFGAAVDLIRLGRQEIVFVAGAEDCDLFSMLLFASSRALTRAIDPALSPCAFDVKRDGFAATGGATVLVLEEYAHARARGAATIYAEVAGWGQSSDGYDVVMPEPNGDGLARAMRQALDDARLPAESVDYVNAHAASTPAGDRAELRALKRIFKSRSPLISSTKSQTGHALSMAGAMEAAFCCLALREGFVPPSMNIRELDPEAKDLHIVTAPTKEKIGTAMSNSSGFGGANIVLILKTPSPGNAEVGALP